VALATAFKAAADAAALQGGFAALISLLAIIEISTLMRPGGR